MPDLAPANPSPLSAPPAPIRCIAVDDEPLALGLVCAFIEQTPFLQLVSRHASAVDALRALHEHPDVQLLFLDIQMPDLSGLELARVLQRTPTRVIFTTAYNQYALEGYRVDALDYLLKPFNYEEFLRAALKARVFFERPGAQPPGPPNPATDVAALAAPAEERDGEFLFLRVEYQLVRVAFSDIRYAEGLKDYVKVHLASSARPLLSLLPLRQLEEKLPPRRFMRVHRSYIVNLDQISTVGRGTVEINGATIPVSDNYREAFDQWLSRMK